MLDTVGRISFVVALIGILALSGWFSARAWVLASGTPMPVAGYVAMGLGVFFSIVVGCGLMALLFYSSRHGYDDLNRQEREKDES